MNTLRFLQIVSSDPIYNVHVLRDPPVLLIDIPTFGIWRRYLNQIFPFETKSLRSLLASEPGTREEEGGSGQAAACHYVKLDSDAQFYKLIFQKQKYPQTAFRQFEYESLLQDVSGGERGPANIIGYAHPSSHQHAPLGRRLHSPFHLLGLDQCLPQSNKTTSSPHSGPRYDAGPDVWRPETTQFHDSTFCVRRHSAHSEDK